MLVRLACNSSRRMRKWLSPVLPPGHHRQADAEHQVAQCQVQGDLEDGRGPQQARNRPAAGRRPGEEGARQALQHVEQGAQGVPLAGLGGSGRDRLAIFCWRLTRVGRFHQQQATHQQQRSGEGEQETASSMPPCALPIRLEQVGDPFAGMAGQLMNHLPSMGLLLLRKMCCCRVNSMEA